MCAYVDGGGLPWHGSAVRPGAAVVVTDDVTVGAVEDAVGCVGSGGGDEGDPPLHAAAPTVASRTRTASAVLTSTGRGRPTG
jgi:hypothetical protein